MPRLLQHVKDLQEAGSSERSGNRAGLRAASGNRAGLRAAVYWGIVILVILIWWLTSK